MAEHVKLEVSIRSFLEFIWHKTTDFRKQLYYKFNIGFPIGTMVRQDTAKDTGAYYRELNFYITHILEELEEFRSEPFGSIERLKEFVDIQNYIYTLMISLKETVQPFSKTTDDTFTTNFLSANPALYVDTSTLYDTESEAEFIARNFSALQQIRMQYEDRKLHGKPERMNRPIEHCWNALGIQYMQLTNLYTQNIAYILRSYYYSHESLIDIFMAKDRNIAHKLGIPMYMKE